MMTSRRPCWCPKRVGLWELNSFLMQTLCFVSIHLHRCWPREWKHFIGDPLSTTSSSILTSLAAVSLYTDVVLSFFFVLLKNIGERARENERGTRQKDTTTALRWRSINLLRFIFYLPRSTDFEEKSGDQSSKKYTLQVSPFSHP